MRPGGKPDNVTALPEEHDRQLSSLYRRLDRPEPPRSLDNQILRAAQMQVVRREPRPRPSLAQRRVPLPLVALLLVGLGTVPLLSLYWRESPPSDSAPPPPVTPSEGGQPSVPPAMRRLETDQAVEADAGAALPEPAPPVAPSTQEVADAEAAELVAGIRQALDSGQVEAAWQGFGELRRRFPALRIDDALLNELAAARDAYRRGQESAP